MSIHFMTEGHSFIRLDDKPEDIAIDKIKEYMDIVGGRYYGKPNKWRIKLWLI